MELNTNPMTARIPSNFALPVCGHASMTSGTLPFAGSATTVVNEHRTAVITGGVTGDLGLAAHVPGTTAWSPPPS